MTFSIGRWFIALAVGQHFAFEASPVWLLVRLPGGFEWHRRRTG